MEQRLREEKVYSLQKNMIGQMCKFTYV